MQIYASCHRQWLAALITVVFLPLLVKGAPPQLQPLNGQSLRSGAATVLVLEGSDFLPSPVVLLPFSTASHVLRPGSTGNRAEVEIKLPADVPPGIYLMRLGNSKGISNAVAVSVDDLPAAPLSATLTTLPASLHCTLNGSDTVRTSFTGKKGQHVLVDLESRRLGSQLDPVLEVYAPGQKLLSLAQGQARLHGDVRLELDLPLDGTYSVELHDALFRAASPGFFRMKIGDLHFADAIFPIGVERGKLAKVHLLGRLPASPGLEVTATDPLADSLAVAPRLPGLIGPLPRLVVSDVPEVLQAAPADEKVQEITVPAAINGRLAAPGTEDRYRLKVQAGMALRFDVFANRIGSPLDGVLALRMENGSQVAASDDRPDTIDPGFDYTVPPGVSHLLLALNDLHRRGGPDFLYRISITPAQLPGFSLVLSDERVQIPIGGNALVRVRANRANYNGPIRLRIAGLPDGVALRNDTIAVGENTALIGISIPPKGTVQPRPFVGRVEGVSTDPSVKVTRVGTGPDSPVTQGQPWLQREFGVAIVEPSPIQIEWVGAAPRLPLGAGLPIIIKLARDSAAKGPVRLSLITTQTVPKRPDGQEDVNQAIRLDGTASIPAEKNEATAKILIPAKLSRQPYDLALRAELLGPGGAVVASAVTEVRRLEPGAPFDIELAGKPEIELKPGSDTKLAVKLNRYGDFDKPVTLNVEFQDSNVALRFAVPTGQTSFELPVGFTAGVKPGATTKLKLFGIADGATPGSQRSNEIAVSLKTPGSEPAPKK
jgi:hypothetical protein